MRRLSRRLSPAMVVSLLALFLAMGGSAFAAKKYVLTKRSQIAPKLLKQLKGRTGPAGAAGATGAQGPKGDTGARGPSNAYSTTIPPLSSPAGSGNFTVGTLSNLPAGSYVLLAKANINNNHAADTFVTCQLVAGGDVDETYIGTRDGSQSVILDKQQVGLNLTHTFASTGTVTLQCDNPGGGANGIAVENTRITAIRVESLG